MKQYKEFIKRIKLNGTRMPNRTGTDTIKVSGEMIKIDLQEGFPVLTCKKTAYKAAIAETFGFFRAYSSAADFRSIGVKIWDKNANDPGKEGHHNVWLDNLYRLGEDDLGGVYGVNWRKWPGYKTVPADNVKLAAKLEADGWVAIGKTDLEENETDSKIIYYKAIDQLGECVRKIIETPTDRRIIFHAWNCAELDAMALPPCHTLYQFLPNTVSGEMDMCLYVRSNDAGLGTPFNMIGAATILTTISRLTGFKPRWLTIFIGDAHIYVDQLDYLDELLTKEPLPLPVITFSDRVPGKEMFSLSNPNWVSDAVKWLVEIKPEDLILQNYQHHTLETPVPGMAV